MLQNIWDLFVGAEVDLYVSEISTHCPHWFSLMERTSPLGQDPLARKASLLLSTVSSDIANAPQSSPTWPQTLAGGPSMASQYLVFPTTQALSRDALAPPRQKGPSFTTRRSDHASRFRPPSTVGLAAGGPDHPLTDCRDPVKRTILNASLQYKNRCRLFSDWCAVQDSDPVRCPVAAIFEFLQSLRTEAGLSLP